MDMEKATALLRAIEGGSITYAAEVLNYTTSGVSKMISSLEHDVGFNLLVRGRKGVKPTENCKKILPTIKEMVYWNNNIEEIILDINGIKTGNISVGTAYGKYYRWISKVISEFCKKYPNIGVNIIHGTSSGLSRAVENKEADFCIISQRNGDYDWKPLLEDELVAMISKDHKYSSQDNFPISEFLNESFIEIYPEQETDNSRIFKMNNIDIEKSIRFSAIDSYAASHMVEANLGVSLVNTLIKDDIDAEVVFKKIDPPQIVEIGIAYPSNNKISPAAKHFLEFAKKYIDDINR